MKNLFKIIVATIFTVVLSCQSAFAEVINIDASGNYIMSNEKDESMKNAQKYARNEAISNAREQVEDYIRNRNPDLSQNEIQIIAKKVLKITEENTVVRLVKGSNKQVEVVSNIKASFDTDKLQKIIKRRSE